MAARSPDKHRPGRPSKLSPLLEKEAQICTWDYGISLSPERRGPTSGASSAILALSMYVKSAALAQFSRFNPSSGARYFCAGFRFPASFSSCAPHSATRCTLQWAPCSICVTSTGWQGLFGFVTLPCDPFMFDALVLYALCRTRATSAAPLGDPSERCTLLASVHGACWNVGQGRCAEDSQHATTSASGSLVATAVTAPAPQAVEAIHLHKRSI